MTPNGECIERRWTYHLHFLLHPNVVRYFYSIFTDFCFAEQNVKCNFYYYLCHRIGKGGMIPNVDILSDAGHITFIFLLHPNIIRYFDSIFTNFCFAEQNILLGGHQ